RSTATTPVSTRASRRGRTPRETTRRPPNALASCWRARSRLASTSPAPGSSTPVSSVSSGRTASTSAGESTMAPARIPAARRRAGIDLAWDVRFFGKLGPDGLPGRDVEAEGATELLDLGGEGLADLVVVAELEAIRPVDLVLGRAGT